MMMLSVSDPVPLGEQKDTFGMPGYSIKVVNEFVNLKTPTEEREKLCLVYRLPLILLRVIYEMDQLKRKVP